MNVTIKDLTEEDVLGISAAGREPEWLRDRRQEAFKAFADLPWPKRKDEAWRYTDPARFDLDRPVMEVAGERAPGDRGIVAALGDAVAARVRLVDGGVAEIDDRGTDGGLVVSDLATAARSHEEVVREHLGSVVGTDEKFDAANLAAFTGGVFVHVPRETVVEEPIAITVEAQTAGTAVPRVLVVLDAFAQAKVYVDHVGAAESTVVEVVEVVVGDGAAAQVVTSQDWGEGVDHIASHRGLVYRDGLYRHLEATLGGRTVYIRPDVRLDHEGARAEMYGVYFGSGDQRLEHRSLIHHNASKTASESIYKGALQGTSRATWYGNIVIEPHARATSSDETNRNLILSDGARADSIPFLEIKCSDVISCGHHSSVGQVDEVQLFYLESRGIPREEAVRMLVFGFFGEVTDRIDLPAVTETVLAEIEGEIQAGAPTALMDPRRSGA